MLLLSAGSFNERPTRLGYVCRDDALGPGGRVTDLMLLLQGSGSGFRLPSRVGASVIAMQACRVGFRVAGLGQAVNVKVVLPTTEWAYPSNMHVLPCLS